jgi:ribosomal-protein-alanine N-acetyltransferase
MNNNVFAHIRLKTERLIVRPFEPDDAEQLHAIVSQPRVLEFLPEDVMTLKEVQSAIEWFQKCYRENTPERIVKWTLAIVLAESSRVIGWCGLGPLDFGPEETELFCGLDEAFWGKGIAPEACAALLDYAFASVGLGRVVAVVDPANKRSRRLIEKLGMKFEKQVSGLPEEHKHYENCLYHSISGQ